MSMKVLVVEPDWRFARNVTTYLESHAHLVVQEIRLDNALQRAAHWQPDLVIVAAELAEDGFLDLLAETNPRPAVLLTGLPSASVPVDTTVRVFPSGETVPRAFRETLPLTFSTNSKVWSSIREYARVVGAAVPFISASLPSNLVTISVWVALP